MSIARQNTTLHKAKAAVRYSGIKAILSLRNQSVMDLYLAFCTECESKCQPKCHYSVFYRVCMGQRSSARIQQFVAQKLKVPFKELWA